MLLFVPCIIMFFDLVLCSSSFSAVCLRSVFLNWSLASLNSSFDVRTRSNDKTQNISNKFEFYPICIVFLRILRWFCCSAHSLPMVRVYSLDRLFARSILFHIILRLFFSSFFRHFVWLCERLTTQRQAFKYRICERFAVQITSRARTQTHTTNHVQANGMQWQQSCWIFVFARRCCDLK